MNCAYFFVIILTLFLQRVFAQSCNQLLDCAMLITAGSKVPDPKNCQNYYMCLGGGSTLIPSATPLSCPSGQYYEALTQQCTQETNPPFCNVNYCGQLLAKNLTVCPVVCPSVLPGVFADVSSCSNYFICLAGGITQVATCPANTPYFNGVSCVSNSSQCCSVNTPVCTTPFSQIPDPMDCTAYYICGNNVTVPEIPSASYKYNCPSGQIYNPPTYSCIPGACASTTTPTTTMSTTTTSTPTTTTSTTTTATPITTTTGPVCTPAANFICKSDGYFAQCTNCTSNYFRCSGGVLTVQTCVSNLLFNPVPSYPQCIQPGICPYTPPTK